MLSFPSHAIIKQNFVGPSVAVSVAEMNGWRASMEDEHVVYIDDADSKEHNYKIHIFSIFDGHNGPEAAKFMSSELIQELLPVLRNLSTFPERPQISRRDQQLIKNAILKLDQKLMQSVKFAGCTLACAALFIPNDLSKKTQMLSIHAGDARVLVIDCEKSMVKFHTQDHKPINFEEQRRVERTGGHISEDNRVNGDLAVSRAMGDYPLKSIPNTPLNKQPISAEPEISSFELIEKDVILIACDGVFERMDNNQVAEFVSLRTKVNEEITGSLVGCSLSRGSTDNMSVIGIEFNPSMYKNSKLEEFQPIYYQENIDFKGIITQPNNLSYFYAALAFFKRLPQNIQAQHKVFLQTLELQIIHIRQQQQQKQQQQQEFFMNLS